MSARNFFCLTKIIEKIVWAPKSCFLQSPETSKNHILRIKFGNQILTPIYSTFFPIFDHFSATLIKFWSKPMMCTGRVGLQVGSGRVGRLPTRVWKILRLKVSTTCLQLFFKRYLLFSWWWRGGKYGSDRVGKSQTRVYHWSRPSLLIYFYHLKTKFWMKKKSE